MRLPVLLCLASLLAGCGETMQKGSGSIFTAPVTVRTESPPFADLQSQESPYRYPDLRNQDGTVTRVLWMSPGMGNNLNTLLQNDATWKAANPRPGPALLFKDPNIGPGRDAGTLVGVQSWKEHAGLEPLVLSATPEAVDAATQLVQHVLTSIPQIAIEARVVEVLENDESALGMQWFMLDRQDHPFDPAHPFAALEPTETVFDRSRVGRGVPTLPFSSGAFVPNFLTELGTIQDDIQIDLLISALKTFTKVDVVNAPNVAVLSGFTASIAAGTDLPTFELNIYAGNTAITTKYKKTGVTLDVLPNLIRPDTIRMAVQVRVENITGGVTATAGTSTVTNPIVASRAVTTTMDVRDGSTVILGGLISSTQTGVEDKIPVLGDIPVLNLFFSSKHKADSHSNLIFFIRPKVITPSGKSSSTLILPVPEGEPARPPGEEPPGAPEKPGNGH